MPDRPAGAPGRLVRGARMVLAIKPVYLICAILAIQAIFALFVIRVPPFYAKTSHHFGFVDDYDKLGVMLSEGYGYRFMPEIGPTLVREPGYPLILGGLFRMFGYGLMAARALNLLCAGLSAGLVSRLAGRMASGRAAALLAPTLFLLHPGIFITELRGGVEMVFILLSLCFLGLLYRAARARTLASYLLAGLMLGVTCSVRSTALLFPVFMPLYFWFVERPRPALPAMAGRLCALFLGTLIVLTPWMIRNYRLVGAPVATASVSGTAAHAGQYICEHQTLHNEYQELDSESAAVRVDMAHRQGYQFAWDYYLYFYDPRDEMRFNDWLQHQVMQKYARDPALFARCLALNGFYFWFAGTTWSATLWNAGVQLPYLLLAILGVMACVRAGIGDRIALVVLFCLYSMLVYLPIHAQARYSVPLVPLLALLAAVGFGGRLDALSAQRGANSAS